MKPISISSFLAVLMLAIASCGGAGSLEKKKEQLEKLKAKQSDLVAQIKTLEEEIIAMGDTSGNKNERMKYVAVKVVGKEDFNHYIDVQGRVDGDQNTLVSARAMGPITRILVKTGTQVKKGQVLAELDAEIVRRQLEDLKVNLGFVTEVFNKQKALWEKQVGTEIQYLTAKNNKESMEQKLAALQENLDMYRIKSPIDGTVDEVAIKIGQNVAPGVPCFRVVNTGELKAKSDVAETYASQISEGNPVILNFPDLNREVNSVISFTSRSINQLNRTLTIEAKLPAEKSFIPNMICVFRVLDYQSKSAVVIPVNTIQHAEGKDFVMVGSEQNGHKVAVRKDVVVGKVYRDKAEILSGLSPDDLLITAGYQDINDKEPVKF